MSDSQKSQKNRGFYKKSKKQEEDPKPETEQTETQESTSTKKKHTKNVQPGTVAPPPPKQPPSDKVPAPRHLAARQTPLKNDPAYLDSMVLDGDRGVVFRPPPEPFSPSFDSFMPLIHADYANIVSANRAFGKAVSQSVYSYYNIMHLWARVFAVLRHRKILTTAEIAFLERFEHDSSPVSEPINGYLRCVGNFEDSNGVEHSMMPCARPNKNGHFGRISASTHNYYEAYPAPLIAITRIEKDFEFTQGRARDPIWEIPTLRPTEAQTRNQSRPAPIIPRQEMPNRPPTDDENRLDVGLEPLDGGGLSQSEEPAEIPPDDIEPDVTTRDMPTANLLGWYRSELLTTAQI